MNMKNLRYVLCDVFTEHPLQGNPLAVFTDARDVDGATLQALAREMNLSETVFVLPAEGGGHARIRIFTPKTELAFAGHPTLGAAFVLGQPLQRSSLRLETGSGVVEVRLEREGARVVFGWMDQPIPHLEPFSAAPELLEALGLDAARLPIEVYDNGPKHAVVVVDDEERVARLVPDGSRLAKIVGVSTVGVCAGSGERWKARVFAPAVGVSEDPATGSFAGPLALHLARHGLVPFGAHLRIDQGAELQRPSVLWACAHGAREAATRVEVGGSAVILARGEFRWA